MTYTEISVEWTPVTVTGEMIQYKASIAEEADSLVLLPRETSHTFTGLTQGANYTINVGTSLNDSDDYYDSEYATVVGMTGKIKGLDRFMLQIELGRDWGNPTPSRQVVLRKFYL